MPNLRRCSLQAPPAYNRRHYHRFGRPTKTQPIPPADRDAAKDTVGAELTHLSPGHRFCPKQYRGCRSPRRRCHPAPPAATTRRAAQDRGPRLLPHRGVHGSATEISRRSRRFKPPKSPAPSARCRPQFLAAATRHRRQSPAAAARCPAAIAGAAARRRPESQVE